MFAKKHKLKQLVALRDPCILCFAYCFATEGSSHPLATCCLGHAICEGSRTNLRSKRENSLCLLRKLRDRASFGTLIVSQATRTTFLPTCLNLHAKHLLGMRICCLAYCFATEGSSSSRARSTCWYHGSRKATPFSCYGSQARGQVSTN